MGEKDKFTTIRVNEKTRQRLLELGVKGQSYDQLLQQLINLYEEQRK